MSIESPPTTETILVGTARLPVVQMNGEYDLTDCDTLRTIIEVGADDADLLTLDLRDATFLDSTTIGVLTAAASRMRNRGKDVVTLVLADGLPDRALRLCGVGELLGRATSSALPTPAA